MMNSTHEDVVNLANRVTQQDALIKELVGALDEVVTKFDTCSDSVVRNTPLGINRARNALASIATPAPTLWAPVAGKIGLMRDGRRVTNLRRDADGDWLGDIVGGASNDTWNSDGSYFFASDKRRSDLVACADEGVK